MTRTSGRIRLTGALLIGFGLAAGCGAGAEGGEGEDADSSRIVAVAVDTFEYLPPTLQVRAGTTVRWTNDDRTAHTVTSGVPQEQGVPGVSEGRDAKPDGVFDGELSEKGSTFAVVLNEPGELTYFCRIHAGMVATVIVQ